MKAIDKALPQMKAIYNKEFFNNLMDSLRSAKVIVPIVLSYIQPKSVIDIGCGTGEFLKVFKECGVRSIMGIEGPWLDLSKLHITKKEFQFADLEKSLTINKKFDLAVSLEVAEHISAESAKLFIKSLTQLAPIVLFSAAIPFQGGTNHLNEQWPEYWAQLFEDQGYVPVDCLRDKIWNNPEVDVWYAQNIFFYVKKDSLSKYALLKKELHASRGKTLSRVHPRLYSSKASALNTAIGFVPDLIKKLALKFFTHSNTY